MPESVEAIERRLAQLERRSRVVGLLAVCVVVAAAIMAVRGDDKVRATSFLLMDSDGIVRAQLGFRDGNPGLFVMDDAGVDRLAAVSESDGTGFFVYDEEGVTRIGVAQFAHGGGGIALHGPQSKGAAVLYFKGTGSLRFFDEDGTLTHQILADPENNRD